MALARVYGPGGAWLSNLDNLSCTASGAQSTKPSDVRLEANFVLA